MSEGQQSVLAKAKLGYEQRNSRERGLILVAVLALSYLLLEATVGAWLDEKTLTAQRNSQILHQEQIDTQAELAIFAASELSRSNKEQEMLIEHLREKNERLARELGPLQQQVLSRQQFMSLLQGVAENAKDIQLLSMRELAEEKELAQQGAGDKRRAKTLAKHRVRVELNGDYISLAQFLAKLEQSNWPIFWTALNYQLASYPKASMSLDLYTLAPENNGFDSLGASDSLVASAQKL